jgi:hypothetical protein
MKFKKYASVSLLLFLLLGCAAVFDMSDFEPTTRAGAQCKFDCAQTMAQCKGSSYTCDRAAAACMSSCKELDVLSK